MDHSLEICLCPEVDATKVRELLLRMEEYDHEGREVHRLMDGNDYPALVAYLEQVVKRHPGDSFRKASLAEAYLLNDQGERALELLEDLHRRDPLDLDVQTLTLNTLFALGRDETSFPWVEKPKVILLGEEVMGACVKLLRRWRHARSAEALYLELDLCGHYVFTPEELFVALKEDPRFKVGHDEHGMLIKLQRRRRSPRPDRPWRRRSGR